jgi:alpha-1,6-mannosyltransferase
MHLVDTTLFFSPTSGGVKRYLTAKHAWLREHTAHQHSILVPGTETRLTRNGLSTVAGLRLSGAHDYRLPLAPRLWCRMLDALEPDLIEVGDAFHPAWCASRVARARGIPLVAFFHSNLAQIIGQRLGSSSERAIARYLRWLYARFDVVLAPSRLMCSYLNSLGVKRVALQRLGVDATVFSPLRRTLDLRRQLGLPDDTRLLIYAGRFSREKNIPLLHETMARLGRPYHLLQLGGHRRYQPAVNIDVIPYRRDSVELASWLASADALIHAGSNETFGLVVVEAMACGRPVVAIRGGAVPELVDEQVGQLTTLDAASIASAVRTLYERQPDLLGQRARERVLRHFTWSQALQLQLATYASTCGVSRAALAPRPEMELDSPGP